MIFVKRVSLLVFLILLLILALSSRNRNYRPTLQSLSQKVGLGEYIYDEEDGYTTNPVHDPNYPSYESDTAAGRMLLFLMVSLQANSPSNLLRRIAGKYSLCSKF